MIHLTKLFLSKRASGYQAANKFKNERVNPQMSDITEVTDANFEEEVLNSEIPVLVDYWAEWCAPCKAIAPVLDAVAESYKEKLKVCKINVDQNTATPAKYNIRGIPTLMIFKNGTIEVTKVGVLTKMQLAELIDDIV